MAAMDVGSDELDAEDRAARRATRLVAASSMGALLVVTGLMAHSGASRAAADTGSTDGPSTSAATDTAAATTTDAATTTTAAPTTTTQAPTTTTTCASTYVVQSGDSWYLLAQEASVSADALLAANGASASTSLHPGQTLCLPDGAVVVTTVAPVTVATPATTPATSVTKSTTATTTPAPSHTTAASG